MTEQYIEDAHRTLSTSFHSELVPFDALRHAFGLIVANGVILDEIKKALFYGRPIKDMEAEAGETDFVRYGKFLSSLHPDRAKAENILHAIIGKMTEVCELIDALGGMTDGDETKLDLVNVVEEVGDGFWYDAILLKAIGSDFEQAQRINIAKLKKRFPDRFTETQALKRDLPAERKTLEGQE